MHKICILLDPNKRETENVLEACTLLKERLSEKAMRKLEFWVGCTTSPYKEIIRWLNKLKEKNIEPRNIYPGRLHHVMAYFHANRMLIPILMNWSNDYVYYLNLLGRSVMNFFPNKVKFGYFILGPNSRVGRKVGANVLPDKEILRRVKKFLRKNPNVDGVYLEAGSGVSRPVKLSLIKKVKKVLGKRYNLIVGGGIKNPLQGRNIFKAGADKIVVGTIFERSNVDEVLNLMVGFSRL